MARQLYLLSRTVIERLAGGSSVAIGSGHKVYVLRVGAMPAETKTITAAGQTLLVQNVGDLKVGDVVQVGSVEGANGLLSGVNRATNTLTFGAVTGSLAFSANDSTKRVMLTKGVNGHRISLWNDDSGVLLKSEFIANGYLTSDANGRVWAFIDRPNFDLRVELLDGSVQVINDSGRAVPLVQASVHEFGVIGDGVVDDTTAWIEALTTAVADKLRLVIPTRAVIRSSLGFVVNGVLWLEGSGRQSPTLNIIGAGVRALDFQAGSDGSVVRGLQIVDTTGQTATGIRTAATVSIHAVSALLCSVGFEIGATSLYSLLDNVAASLSALNGLLVSGRVDVRNSIITNSGQHGVNIAAVGGGSLFTNVRCLDNGAAVPNTYDGFFLADGSNQSVFNACMSSNSAGAQRYGLNISGAGCQDNMVMGGIYKPNAVGGINDSGTNTHLEGPVT